MTLSALLLAGALLGAPEEAPPPVLRVHGGHARVLQRGGTRELTPASGRVSLDEHAWVECGALTRVALTWRGWAGVTLEGPAGFEFGPGPSARLEDFRSAELETRRGVLALELEGFGSLQLGPGAARLRRLPGGLLEVLNRGGAELEVQRPELGPVLVPPGRSVRLRALPASTQP